MNDVQNRLLQFIKSIGLSVRAFERKCGLSYGYVGNMVNSISPRKLMSITHQFPELNGAWLLTGEGTMLNSSNEKNDSILSRLDNLNTEDLVILLRVYEKETAMQKEQIADLKEQVDFLKSLINKQ